MSLAAYQQGWDFNSGSTMGYKMASQQYQPFGSDVMNAYHVRSHDQNEEQQQEAVVRKLSVLSMYIQGHPLQNRPFHRQSISLAPPENSSPHSVLEAAQHSSPSDSSDTGALSDSENASTQAYWSCTRGKPSLAGISFPSRPWSSSQEHDEIAASNAASDVQRIVDWHCKDMEEGDICMPASPPSRSGEGCMHGITRAEPLEELKQHSQLMAGEEISVRDSDSSSLSMSDSREDSSGASGEVQEEMEGESVLKTSGLRRTGASLSQKRSLSTHFMGKSRSFTSLADVTGIQSIQDLAKPENPYAKRRKSLHNATLLERHRSFPLRSVEGAISKKSHGKNGSSLAVALAMSAAEGNTMETLVEDANEGCGAHKRMVTGWGRGQPIGPDVNSTAAGGLHGHVNGVRGAALQSSWRNVWHSSGPVPQRSVSMVDLFESGISPPCSPGSIPRLVE